MMIVDWKQLDPSEFEQLCYLILEANGFTDLQWYGKSGGDKGRDIVARKTETPLPSIKRETKWIAQCKRFITRPPGINELSGFLNNCREHKPHTALLMLTNTLNANVKDWLEAVRPEYTFNIYVWEERDLIREIAKHRDSIAGYIPKIYSTGESILFYQRYYNDIVIGCNEIDDVEFIVRSCDSYEQARKKVEEFITFIRQNDIIFD